MNAAELDRLLAALSFAARRHKDQRRKGAEASPYINHPIDLAVLLVREGGITDLDVLCAALLHDTIEDTDTTSEEIEERFGARIRAVVDEVTDDKALPKAERKRLQVEHAATASEAARLVKLADKICNLRDLQRSPPRGWDLARKREYFDWAREVVDRIRGIHPQLESLFDDAYRQRP